VEHDLVTEHLYVRRMESGSEALDRQVESNWQGRQSRRNLLIATFFGVNLAFGVFGTLLMYTRERREEAGVRRAFGATKWSVFCGFIREAWLLTTVSVVIGCIIYFQYTSAHGLYELLGHNPAVRYWFDDFGTHFLVVSVIVYLIILCAVLIATAIPAWRICRSEITVALKDE
jgi:ABC-type antimicrobial peptide transport system permease subunit